MGLKIEYRVDGEIQTKYSGRIDVENVPVPTREGFTSVWVSHRSGEKIIFDAKYRLIDGYKNKIFLAKYWVCGKLLYCIPFTIETGIIYDFVISLSLENRVGWKYTVLEAKDLDITLTSNPIEINKARKMSSKGTWRDTAKGFVYSVRNNADKKPNVEMWNLSKNHIVGSKKVSFPNTTLHCCEIFSIWKYIEISGNVMNCVDCNSYVEALNNLCEKTRNPKKQSMNVVLLGIPGSGKTTTICNWLNLLKEGNDCTEPDDNQLLPSRGGKTTLCETHLKPTTERSKIVVEYYSGQDLDCILMKFTDLYISVLLEGNVAFESSSGSKLPHEMIELICNITQIPNLGDMDETKKFLKVLLNKNNRQSPEGELSEYEYFISLLSEKIVGQVRREFTFNDDSFEQWLSETYNGINSGTNGNNSIPKSITIMINKKDFSKLRFPGRVREIIDTIGLDDIDFVDLDTLLASDDNLCVFIEKTTEVPSTVICNIMSSCCEKFGKGSILKCMIAVNYKDENELIDARGSDGDFDKGIQSKMSDIRTVMMCKGIDFDSSNVFFMNSHQAYYKIDKTHYSFDNDESDNFYYCINDEIVNAIDRYFKNLRPFIVENTDMKIKSKMTSDFPDDCKGFIGYKRGRKYVFGRKTVSDGGIFEGYWEDNMPLIGRLVYTNGDNYCGELCGEKPDGYGIMRYATGEIFKGQWSKGNKMGCNHI